MARWPFFGKLTHYSRKGFKKYSLNKKLSADMEKVDILGQKDSVPKILDFKNKKEK